MKNECLRLIGSDKPATQHHKPRHEQNMHIVSETIDGQVVETRLPKEQAQSLFRKIRSAGGDVTVAKEVLTQKEDVQKIKRATRSEAQERLPQSYCVYQDMKKDIDDIFDYIEHLEETNEILEHTLKQATDAVLERNEVLEEHKRLHSELNDILHQNTTKPTNPSLCDLIAYVQHDLKK